MINDLTITDCRKKPSKKEKFHFQIFPLVTYHKLILSYKSQFKTFIWLFPFYLIHMIFKRNAIIQKINPNKFYTRPHKGKLLYEKRGMEKFENIEPKMIEFETWLKKN